MPTAAPSLLHESLGLQEVFVEGSQSLGPWSWLRPRRQGRQTLTSPSTVRMGADTQDSLTLPSLISLIPPEEGLFDVLNGGKKE